MRVGLDFPQDLSDTRLELGGRLDRRTFVTDWPTILVLCNLHKYYMLISAKNILTFLGWDFFTKFGP
mgnify:CR=1 FL=1